MAQGGMKLNKSKPQKSGGATRRQQKHLQVSKVDILKKKKKAEASGGGLMAEAVKQQRKVGCRTEANIAARVQVENGGALTTVQVTAQQLAKAKQNLSGLKQKEKFNQ
mmetsp:Transcript_119183/g.186017  ORF Transcript_119183/g.186017 Transcript_119183/m.186017 type:complete len:108 (+) Transcript_119183:77-400(+)